MRSKLLVLSSLFLLLASSCSNEEEVVTPPAPNKYTLTITADTGGSVSSPGGTYNEGSKITVTATPDGMYLFKEWSDGSTLNPREITVTSNLTLKASFIKKTYPLAVTVEGEGTVQEEVIIQGSTSETTYNAGTTVRLTATPNEGWVFAGWSGDVESEELVIEVPIEKGTSVSALFKRDSFELNITIEGEGTVKEEVIVQPGQYDYETVVRLTAIPADGWKFANWSGDIESEEVVVEVELTSEVNLTVSFEYALFVSRAERYSPINETTGYYSKTRSFQRYITLDEARYLSNNTNDHMFSNFNATTTDFNKDGKLDLFWFGMSRNSWNNALGFHDNGKYFIISDYFSQIPPYEIISYDSSLEFLSGGIDKQDIDQDGIEELLLYSTNVHQVGTSFISNTSNPPVEKGVIALKVDQNFNLIEEREIGTPKTLHRGTSGDIDNDGDIDILNFPTGHPIMKSIFEKWPTILYNNSDGSFDERLIFKDASLEDFYWSLGSLSNDFFDLDDDGNLDLIFGHRIGTPEEEPPVFPGVNWLILDSCIILWGDGSGTFSWDNKSILSIKNELQFSQSVMGFGFSDYDLDGDIDIIVQSTRTENNGSFDDIPSTMYFSYIINLFENSGNRVFEDVTLDKVEGYYHINREHLGDMGEMMFIDKDDDGDYDLVPKDVSVFCCLNSNYNWAGDLYWENVGGSFVRRIED